MTYTGKCPRCGTVVRGGHGHPIKKIDTPVRKCPKCQSIYLDDNMYEWCVISIPYKLYYIFFANNRFIGWFLLLMLSTTYWNYALIGTVLWIIFCICWFFLTTRKKIAASKERTSNPAYITVLSKSNYDKLAQKFDIYY